MSHFKSLPSKLALILFILLSLPGCAAVALTGIALAAGVGVDHTLNGTVYKTFTTPVDNVQVATLKALDDMAIKVTEKQKTASGWDIKATAANRRIEVQLEALTPKTTRMRVVAKKDKIFFKDSSTATEIIIKTAETLEADAPHV